MLLIISWLSISICGCARVPSGETVLILAKGGNAKAVIVVQELPEASQVSLSNLPQKTRYVRMERSYGGFIIAEVEVYSAGQKCVAVLNRTHVCRAGKSGGWQHE